DATSLAVLKSAGGLGDADNLRYEGSARRVYVGFGGLPGFTRAGIRILDADSAQTVGEIALAAHPESFQLDVSARRLYVNVPGAAHVAVADLDRKVVAAKWSLDGASSNFPMALDTDHHRLFVAT